MDDQITRYYIGLTPDGLRMSVKYGPDPAEKFEHIDPREPLAMDGFYLFPVDQAVWHEWKADDDV